MSNAIHLIVRIFIIRTLHSWRFPERVFKEFSLHVVTYTILRRFFRETSPPKRHILGRFPNWRNTCQSQNCVIRRRNCCESPLPTSIRCQRYFWWNLWDMCWFFRRVSKSTASPELTWKRDTGKKESVDSFPVAIDPRPALDWRTTGRGSKRSSDCRARCRYIFAANIDVLIPTSLRPRI